MKDTNRSLFDFRWRYVSLPVLVLAISIILIMVFYSRLPFPVAFHFDAGGAPDEFAIPGLFVFWTLMPQFLLTIGAILVTWAVSWLAKHFLAPENMAVNPKRIMALTGNMVAIPQIILLYAILDIIIYNVYLVRIQPSILVFSLIVLLLGAIVLTVFLVRDVKNVWDSNKK
jgi:uncharacterized membrane protein